MKRIVSLLIILAMALSLFACKKDEDKSRSFINGVNLEEFSIVYSESDLDYAKRAAEYVKNEILARTGLDLPLVTDAEAARENEIVVGNTTRAISEKLNAETEGLEFAILVDGGSIALEADYFVIAAAAYYFIETCVPTDDFSAELAEGATKHEPIVKEAKNFILLIGDGMGVNHTRLFDHLENTAEYGDGEDIFYGYLLPHMGHARTDSLSGTTDSAAGGTALSAGIKTINGYVGIDENGENVTLLTELFGSLGMGSAVMSTESSLGATPSSFSSHSSGRDSSDEIINGQAALTEQYGTVIDCGYDYYTARYIKTIENHITTTLNKVSANDEGFFLMYEEAHIDKHSHNNSAEDIFLAVIRFNQAIARFMEFAFYNPDTFILITADHETGGLTIGEDGAISFTSDDHTSADVPIFAYGDGAQLFARKTIENIQIAHTIASFVGVYDFGDQSVYKYLR